MAGSDGVFTHTVDGGARVVSIPDIVTVIIMDTVTDTTTVIAVVLQQDTMQAEGRHIIMCIVTANQEYKQGLQGLQGI